MLACSSEASPPVLFDSATDGNAVGLQCTPGERLPCSCSDGTPSTQECLASGAELGACECSGALPDPATTAVPPSPSPSSSSSSTTDGGDETSSTGERAGCSDGNLDADEQCDDRNNVDDDSCNNACVVRCGVEWEVSDASFESARPSASEIDDAGELILAGRVDAGAQLGQLWVGKFSTEGVNVFSNAYDLGTELKVTEVTHYTLSDIVVTGSMGSADAADLFVLKLSSEGVEVWARTYDTGGMDVGTSVASDSNADTVVLGTVAAGEFDTDVFLRKYSADGTVVWTDTIQGPAPADSFDTSRSVVIDGDQNIVFTATLQIDDTTFAQSVSRYFSDGSLDWSILLPPAANTSFGGLALDSSGNPLVALNLDPSGFVLHKLNAADGGELWTVNSGVLGLTQPEVSVVDLGMTFADEAGIALLDLLDQSLVTLRLDDVGGLLCERAFSSAEMAFTPKTAAVSIGGPLLVGGTIDGGLPIPAAARFR